VRVLLSTYGSRGDVEPLVGLAVRLRELGAEVRMCAPPDKEFAELSAVVHHGGAGTTTTAALAGAPQVVVPQGADQPYWAGRVADLGIGAAHDGPTPTTESLSAALKTALTPETRARATAVAGTNRTDGATVAAKLLLDAFSRESRPVSV
jgi:vancomycin aglycone glucosyltransferase